MTTITAELRQAIVAACGYPLRVEDPLTHQVYVVLKEEDFLQLRQSHEPGGTAADSREAEFRVPDAYAGVDESFREGWETPQMAEYDDYEAHRR